MCVCVTGSSQCRHAWPRPPTSPHTSAALCPVLASVLQFLAPANGQESQNVLNYYSLAGINMWGWLGIEACFFASESWAGGRWGFLTL